MTLIAVSMVRDEEDVIGSTIHHLLAEGVDHLIIADNRSTDSTRAILDDYAADGHVTVLTDDEVGYYQSAKMTNLALMAWGMGASWVIPFDADECWYYPGHRLADLVDVDADIVEACHWKHYPTTADDKGEINPFRRVRHRDMLPNRLPKVAFRSHPEAVVHMGNHDVTRHGRRIVGPLELREVPYRSYDQFARKVRNGAEAYAATTLGAQYGTHWRELGALDDAALHRRWGEWHDRPGMIHDPIPWRAA